MELLELKPHRGLAKTLTLANQQATSWDGRIILNYHHCNHRILIKEAEESVVGHVKMEEVRAMWYMKDLALVSFESRGRESQAKETGQLLEAGKSTKMGLTQNLKERMQPCLILILAQYEPSQIFDPQN